MAADANALLIVCADRIVDGTGRPALEKGFVALRQDRIQELGTVEALSKHFPESVRRLEFPGCTILPGFVDSHSHLTFSAGLAPLKDLQGETDGRLILRGAANARLRKGVKFHSGELLDAEDVKYLMGLYTDPKGAVRAVYGRPTHAP